MKPSPLKHTERIEALLQTSAGLDAVLAGGEYLAHLIHYVTISQHWLKYRQQISSIVCSQKHRNLKAEATSLLHNATRQPHRLLNLSTLLGNTRCTTRLLGLLSIWIKVPKMFQSSSNDYFISSINVIQLFAVTTYQLLENIGHLASNGILPPSVLSSKKMIPKLYIWGARALFLHLLLELAKLGKEAWETKETPHGEFPYGKETESKDDKKSSTSDERNMTVCDRRKRLWSCSIWGGLCLYWGSGRTISLLEVSSGGLSFLADFFDFKDTWAQTRSSALV